MMMYFEHHKEYSYEVTGVDRAGKRFKIVTSNPIHAFGINVWKGTLWLVREGKRTMIQRYHK